MKRIAQGIFGALVLLSSLMLAGRAEAGIAAGFTGRKTVNIPAYKLFSAMSKRSQKAMVEVWKAGREIGAFNLYLNRPGVLMPKGMTDEQVQNYSAANPNDWDSTRTRARRRPDGTLVFESYQKAFPRYIRSIADRFVAAADILEKSPSESERRLGKFARELGEAWRSGDFSKVLGKTWPKLDENTPFDFAAFYDDQSKVVSRKSVPRLWMGTKRLDMKKSTTWVRENHDALDKELQQLAGVTSWPAKKAHPMVVLDATEFTPQIPLYEGNSFSDLENHGPDVKALFLGNLQFLWHSVVVGPQIDALLGEGSAAKLTYRGGNDYILAHEANHGMGPLSALVGGSEVPLDKALGEDLYTVVEEGKADAGAVLLYERMYRADQKSRQPERTAADRESFYHAWVGALLAQARNMDDMTLLPESVATMNKLVERGALVKSTGRSGAPFTLNIDKVLPVAQEMAALYLKAQRFADKGAAQAIQSAKLEPGLQKIVDQLNKAKPPTDIVARFYFKKPGPKSHKR